MAEAALPRLVLVLETSTGNDRIATYHLPSDDAISDVGGNPNVAKAVAYVAEYKPEEGTNPPV
jgi:hypothetical protein